MSYWWTMIIQVLVSIRWNALAEHWRWNHCGWGWQADKELLPAEDKTWAQVCQVKTQNLSRIFELSNYYSVDIKNFMELSIKSQAILEVTYNLLRPPMTRYAHVSRQLRFYHPWSSRHYRASIPRLSRSASGHTIDTIAEWHLFALLYCGM